MKHKFTSTTTPNKWNAFACVPNIYVPSMTYVCIQLFCRCGGWRRRRRRRNICLIEIKKKKRKKKKHVRLNYMHAALSWGNKSWVGWRPESCQWKRSVVSCRSIAPRAHHRQPRAFVAAHCVSVWPYTLTISNLLENPGPAGWGRLLHGHSRQLTHTHTHTAKYAWLPLALSSSPPLAHRLAS